MGESGDLAGEWIINENGETIGRERDMVESWKEIVCLPSKTSGFYDLKVSSSYYDDEIGDHIEHDAILRWDTDLKTYSCAEE